MNKEMLLNGVQLMVFGMGMVYVFLIIMIYCMKLLNLVLAPIVKRQQEAEAAAKAAEEKAIADAKAAEAAAALAAKEEMLNNAILNQEKLLAEIRDVLKNK